RVFVIMHFEGPDGAADGGRERLEEELLVEAWEIAVSGHRPCAAHVRPHARRHSTARSRWAVAPKTTLPAPDVGLARSLLTQATTLGNLNRGKPGDWSKATTIHA